MENVPASLENRDLEAILHRPVSKAWIIFCAIVITSGKKFLNQSMSDKWYMSFRDTLRN
jgi:hypothetical protein